MTATTNKMTSTSKGYGKTVTPSKKSEKALSPDNSFADTALDVKLVDKAIHALKKFHEHKSKDKLSLLGNERPVQVQFTLLRAPGRSSPKPIQIVVPHPYFKVADSSESNDEIEDPEICLIVKESSKPWCQEMIVQFPDHMGAVKKVLTLDSLRKKYTSYEQKRELLHKYNMFMADDRILPMLSKSLGKAFIKTKRLPVPIDITREKALPFAIQKALCSTYMTINTGTCITIRAGHTGMDSNKLVKNVMAIVEGAVPKMPRKWANIQLIGIKTADSVSLPIYSKTPEALRDIAKIAGIDEENAVEKGVDERNKKKGQKFGEADLKTKKKRELKSPLLQALKKQKLEEKEQTAGKQKFNPSSNVGGALIEEKEEKLRSKRKTSDASEAKTTQNKRKSGQTEGSNKRKPTATRFNPESNDEDTLKKTLTKDEPKMSNDVAGKEATKVEKQNEFVAAKKFKGSKDGFVFRMGKQGVGYYLDVKPAVDRAAIDAIMRLGQSSTSRRGGHKKNKYKGTRRF